MTNYFAVNGQSLADICMNTYGSMDYFYKLLQDNNVESADFIPYSGQLFVWDETLVVDANIQKTTSLGGIIYATGYQTNNNTFYVVKETPSAQLPQQNTVVEIVTRNAYQKTSATSYESASDTGEQTIYLSALQGKEIIQIEKNIQPMDAIEWAWNSATGVLTLVTAIFRTEKLYIIYTEMITV